MKKTIALLALMTLCFALLIPSSIAKNKGSLAKVTKVHYKKGVDVKPDKPGKPGGKPGSDEMSRSYKYSGIHWTNPVVSYKVDTAGSGLDNQTALSAVTTSFDTWENEYNSVDRVDNSNIDFNYDSSTISQTGDVLNGENTVSWGTISEHGVIAVTTYWYYTGTGELVEFDIEMNKDLVWATDGSSTAFDVQSIATHEAGHTLVLHDLYRKKDNKLTMHGYSSPGEIIKRDLGLGDCLGVEAIYPII